nr:PREDICTED: tubulin polyglutamylase TTLL5-like isoform X2 [Bemisia tabaci]
MALNMENCYYYPCPLTDGISQSIEASSKSQVFEEWTAGTSRNTVLKFRRSALSKPPPETPANILHMTFKTQQAETKLLIALLHSHGLQEVAQEISEFNLLWTGVHLKPQILRAMTVHQRVNHFPRSYELTRKDRLYKNIEKMQHVKGLKHFNFLPLTFVMPEGFRDLTTSHYRHRGPWIIKPVASSRGRGIHIVNSPEDVPLEEPVVVAKYIENPLLINGRKCDLRIYVAVTSYDPLMIYMYEEGFVRFATVKYTVGRKNLWNSCMHLCNSSINKHHSDYIRTDDPDAEDVGSKWTLSALLRLLRSSNVDTESLMLQIEDIVIKSILATAHPIVAACKLFVPHSNCCFELYGFDILVDSDLKPWLLEVNLSPSLGCDSPLDTKIKSAMLADLLTLVGLPAVDPMVSRPATKYRPYSAFVSRREKLEDSLALPRMKKSTASATALSPDESRLIRNVRAQYERRGGFNRIFPSADTWKRYSMYLDQTTGIPISGNSNLSSVIPMTHNYNYFLHQYLFPDIALPLSSKSSKLRPYSQMNSISSRRVKKKEAPPKISKTSKRASEVLSTISLNGTSKKLPTLQIV